MKIDKPRQGVIDTFQLQTQPTPWGSCSISLMWPTRKEIRSYSDAEASSLWKAWQTPRSLSLVAIGWGQGRQHRRVCPSRGVGRAAALWEVHRAAAGRTPSPAEE